MIAHEGEVNDLVIKELKNYRAFKVSIQNKNEQEEAGLDNLFPVLGDSDAVKELKVKQMERTLEQSLDWMERKIIEMKYLSSEEINDIDIYLELGIKKDKFYKKKRSAITNIANSLRII